jgi:hypothetical protein
MKFYSDNYSQLYYFKQTINFIKIISYFLLHLKIIKAINIFLFALNSLKNIKDFEKNTYFWEFILNNKITAIQNNVFATRFYKNGKLHNAKNAAIIYYTGYTEFRLNGQWHSINKTFTKQSWRKFVKLQAFL